MYIEDGRTLKEIKKEFNDKFPLLKIEFYNKPHIKGQGSPKADTLDENLTIYQARSCHTAGDISINGNQKVSHLEEAFLTKYGLYVQVFHKSGEVWYQTTATDHWTLSEHQRAAGEAAASS